MKKIIALLIITVILASTATFISAAEDNLLIHYKMDGGDFGKDELNNSKATIFGTIASAAGKVGEAGQFNGTDSYIWVESDIGPQEKVTITLWAQADFFEGMLGLVVSEWEETGDFCLEYTGNTVEWNNNGVSSHKGTVVLNEEEWYFIACTFNAETEMSYLYINGELDSEAIATSTGPLDFDTFAIGGFVYGSADPSAGQRILPGYIDDVRIYGTDLSQEQIKNIMTINMSDPDPEVVDEPTVTPPAETVPETTAPVEQAPVQTVKAPQTNDTIVLSVAAVITMIVMGVVYYDRRKTNRT